MFGPGLFDFGGDVLVDVEWALELVVLEFEVRFDLFRLFSDLSAHLALPPILDRRKYASAD